MTEGNPVEIATGRKIETTVDWTSGGAIPLTFTRQYSSLFELAVAPTYSRLGIGWRSNFDSSAKLVLESGATQPNAAAEGDRIHIVMPDSNEYTFRLTSGVWRLVLPTYSPGTLVWNQYRNDLDVALTVSAQSFEFRTEDGTKYRYNLDGQLTQIEKLNAYVQNLYYSGPYNTKIIDSLGRTLSFEYWTGDQKVGLLRSVTLSDGKQLKFDFIAPAGTLGSTELPHTTLEAQGLVLSSVLYPDSTPATDTDNPKRLYEYWQNNQYPFSLVAVYDERGVKYGSWTYDTKGRATSSQHGAGDDLTTFSFDDVNNKVTVTNPLGRQTVYSHQTALGMTKRLLSVDGIATANCAASNTAYVLDANGFRSQATDAEGRVTTWTRNSRGLPTEEKNGFGTPQVRTVSTTWDTTLPIPTQIVKPGLTTNLAYGTAGLVSSVTQIDTTSTTLPYSTNGQTRVTTYGYTTFTPPAPPSVGPTGTALADVPLTLTNANAETGNTAGWTSTAGALAVLTTAPCNVSKCFYGGTASQTAAHQSVSIPAANMSQVDSGLRAAKITWKQNSWQHTDRATIRLIFFNQSGVQIDSGLDELRAERAWTQRELVSPIPVGTRTIRVQMIMERVSGTPNDGYVDDLALSLVADAASAVNPFVRLVNADSFSGTTGWT